MINGREVTPEEFAQYRATGKLPMNNEVQIQSPQGQGVKKDGILAKLGRNKEIQETGEILSCRTKFPSIILKPF